MRTNIKDMERRSFAVVELRVEGDEKPKIKGHAAIFNSLSEKMWDFREMIEPGFFKDVLQDDVRGLFNHDSNIVLGRTTSGTLDLEEDELGLRVEIDPPSTTLVNDMVLEPMRRGDVNQMSFGFSVKSKMAGDEEDGDEWVRTGDEVVRVLKAGGCKRLYDVSPVTYPAYPETSVAVRSRFEEFQKDHPGKRMDPDAEAVEAAKREAQVRRMARRRRMELEEKRYS